MAHRSKTRQDKPAGTPLLLITVDSQKDYHLKLGNTEVPSPSWTPTRPREPPTPARTTPSGETSGTCRHSILPLICLVTSTARHTQTMYLIIFYVTLENHCWTMHKQLKLARVCNFV